MEIQAPRTFNYVIPPYIQVGGQTIEIKFVDTIEGGSLGESLSCGGYIKIADNSKGYKQTGDSKLNTFIHECTHLILDNMGRGDLSQDEQFVCTFSGFATEILKSILNQNLYGE